MKLLRMQPEKIITKLSSSKNGTNFAGSLFCAGDDSCKNILCIHRYLVCSLFIQVKALQRKWDDRSAKKNRDQISCKLWNITASSVQALLWHSRSSFEIK